MQARLPGDKLLKARAMLSSWSHKRSCYLRDVQSLIGTLQFACRVIPLGRAFLQHIIQLTKGHNHPWQVIFLNNDFPKDVVMWQLFLSYWNGVSLFLLPPTLNPHRKFTCSPMHPVPLVMRHFSITFGSKVDGSLNTSMGISITWQELFPIYLVCMVWGPLWANHRICFHCENQAVVAILPCKSSRIPRAMNLIRLVTFQTSKYNLTFSAGVLVPLPCTRCIAYSLSHPCLPAESLTMQAANFIFKSIATST